MHKWHHLLLLLVLAGGLGLSRPVSAASDPGFAASQGSQALRPASGVSEPRQPLRDSRLNSPIPSTASLYLPIIHKPGFTSSLYGVETFSLLQGGGVEEMAQAGAGVVRRNALLWAAVEPYPGARNWSALASMEDELLHARELGVEVILMVRQAPDWAQKYSGSSCGPIQRQAFEPFAQFMHDVVERYSAQPYHVRYWEIWNEPDVPFNDNNENPFGCWGQPGDPYFGGGYYGEMLQRVYPQIKAANPDAQVLVGGLLLDCDPLNPPEDPPGSGQHKDCTPARFLEGVLAGGGGSAFDGVSFHTYDYYYGVSGQYYNPNWHSSWDTTGPTLAAKVSYLRGLLANYGVPDKAILASEVAILCNAGCDDAYEHTKSAHLARAYDQAARLRLATAVWYDVFGGWRESGLLYRNGQPRPAYAAYDFSHFMLASARYSREVSWDGVKAYEYSRAGRLVWVAWSQDGSIRQATLPGLPYAIYDVHGNLLPVSETITLDEELIYIDWGT